MSEEEKYLSQKELAKKLSVTTRTVDNMKKDGRIKRWLPVKNGMYKYSEVVEDLQQFQAEQISKAKIDD